MAENESFKLGELSSFTLPSVQKASTSNRIGNDRNNEFANILNNPNIDSGRDSNIKRRRKTSDFSKAFDSAVEGLKASGHGALAAAGTALDFNDFAEAEIKAAEKNQRKADRLAHNLIMDVGDIRFDKGVDRGFSDLGDYLINGAGSVAPSILETIASGVAGAAVGSVLPGAGTVAGGIVGGTAKILGKKKLQSLIKEYVTTRGFKNVAGQSAKRIALNKRKKKIVDDAISKFYQTAGVLASGQTLGTGEIFNEAIQAGASKEEASQFGLIGGVPFAALDAVLPGSIIEQIGKKGLKGRLKNSVQEAATSFVKEGSTEAAQEELLLRTKANFDKDFNLSGDEASSRRLNSFILGGLSGATIGGLTGATKNPTNTKELKTPISNTDFSNKEVASLYSKLQSFKNTNDRFLNLLNTDADQSKVKRVLANSVRNIENLKKELSDKYLSEDNKDLSGKEDALEVIKVSNTYLDLLKQAQKDSEDIASNDLNTEVEQATKDQPNKINPEYKHIDGIQERVLGIAQSIDEDLTKGQLKSITKKVQDRLFKLPDQNESADSVLSDLEPIIKEDILESQRQAQNLSQFEEVAKKQKTTKKVRKAKSEEVVDKPVEPVITEPQVGEVTVEPTSKEVTVEPTSKEVTVEPTSKEVTVEPKRDTVSLDISNTKLATQLGKDSADVQIVEDKGKKLKIRVELPNGKTVVRVVNKDRLKDKVVTSKEATPKLNETIDTTNESIATIENTTKKEPKITTPDGRVIPFKEYEKELEDFHSALPPDFPGVTDGEERAKLFNELRDKDSEILDIIRTTDTFGDIVREALRDVEIAATSQKEMRLPPSRDTILTSNLNVNGLTLFAKNLRKALKNKKSIMNDFLVEEKEFSDIKKRATKLLRGISKFEKLNKTTTKTKDDNSFKSVKDSLQKLLDEEETKQPKKSKEVKETVLDKLANLSAEDLKKAKEESLKIGSLTKEQLESIKDSDSLPQDNSTIKKDPKRVKVKRKSRSKNNADINDVGFIDGEKLLLINDKQASDVDRVPLEVHKESKVKVQVLNVRDSGDLEVVSEPLEGVLHTFVVSRKSFRASKKAPSLQDNITTQIEIEDKVKEKRNPDVKTNSKVIKKAKPSIKNTTIKEEVKELDTKISKGKATKEDLIKALEVKTQIENTKEAEVEPTLEEALDLEITSEDIAIEKQLAALSKEVKRKRSKAVKLSDEDIARLDVIKTNIGELQEAKALLDPEFDADERREIQKEIAALHEEKVGITGNNIIETANSRHIIEKVTNKRKDIDEGDQTNLDDVYLNSVIVDESPSSKVIYSNLGIIEDDRDNLSEASPEQLAQLNHIVKKVSDNLSEEVNREIFFEVVNNDEEFHIALDRNMANVSSYVYSKGFIDNSYGFVVTNLDNTKTIYLVAKHRAIRTSPTFAAGTLMHELVGHVGLSKVFGNKLKDFNLSLLKSNIALRNDILSLSKRWDSYLIQWHSVNDLKPEATRVKLNNSNSFVFKDPDKGKAVRIPKEVAARLSEEYLAELASIKMLDRTFKVKTSLREGFIKKVLKKISHLTRSLLGKFNSGVNEEDLLAAIAASADVLFKDPSIPVLDDLNKNSVIAYNMMVSKDLNLNPTNGRLKVDRNLQSGVLEAISRLENPEPIMNAYSKSAKEGVAAIKARMSPTDIAFSQSIEDIEVNINQKDLLDGRRAAITMGANEAITKGVVQALHSNYGKLNESSRVAWINNVGRSIRSNPMAQKFFSLGNLPYRETYNAVQAVTKGKIGKLEVLSRRVNKQFNQLSAFQKEQVYSYFTSRLEDSENRVALSNLRNQGIPITTINTIIESKETIESLGQQLVDLNMLNADSFEENRGRYLPTRYLKYLFSNPGGGKKTSLLNFLKKDGNLDEDTRAMLGEIKDPSFLVSETIGMIGRDTAILQMLDSLASNGSTGSTSWVLNSEDFVDFRGKGRSQDWLAKEISRIEQILNDSREDTTGAFQLTPDQLSFNEQTLSELKDSQSRGEQAILARMKKEAIENGQEQLSPEEYQSLHYKKMKVGRRYGKLSGLWVRKEIYNDLEGVLKSFEVDPDDPISKWFGGNGYLVKANSYWKMLKVPFNVPSWFRNGVGNLTLLDMSTDTNIASLMKMFKEEVGSAVSKKESKYWKIAVDNGLFGTTYSANELYSLRRDFDKRMKQADRNEKAVSKSKVKDMFYFMNDHFLTAADYASQGFGLFEGSFKTVALRDFIQQWQVENNVSNIDTLTEDRRQAVILEAVAHANKALFDYSQVPPAISALRRYPLGAPFITFMYKSFPIIIESMAKRPQKFIKYAALPMMMTTLAQSMNDWDDKDIERLEASLPNWTKDKSSVFLYPFKDSLGRPQFADYSYALPWSPFVDAALKVNNHFEANNISSAVTSSLALGQDISDDLGFLGGPLSSIITAWKGNRDAFTGRPIINPGDNPTKKVADLSSWLWNMAMPSWLTSHGFLGKLYDDIGISLPGISAKPLDKFGKSKETLGQTFGSLTGFAPRGFNPQDSIKNNLKDFNRRLIEINKSRASFLKDPNNRRNPKERAKGLREFNTRRKLLIKERAAFLNKVRG